MPHTSPIAPRIVFITSGAAETSNLIARALIDEKLAACVNVMPGVRSFYRWEGARHEDAEELLMVKTTESAIPRLEARVRELHRYSTPEFIVMAPAYVEPSYLAWLQSNCAS